MTNKKHRIVQKGTDSIVAIVANLFCWFLTISCLYPVVWMIYSSLKTNAEFSVNVFALPADPQWSNYVTAFSDGQMSLYALNSLWLSVVTTVISLLVAFMLGYAFARFQFRGRNLCYMLFMMGMLIPTYALLLPVFIEFKTLGLLNKAYTLLLPYIAFALPVAIFLFESYLRGIPTDLEEASYIDGCGTLRAMFLIIFPICKPVLATCGILTFLGTWNEFPLALVLISKNAYKTIPIGLTYFTGAYTTSFPLLFAGLTIASLPVLLVYFFLHNQIMEGMVAGSIKG